MIEKTFFCNIIIKYCSFEDYFIEYYSCFVRKEECSQYLYHKFNVDCMHFFQKNKLL